MRGVKLPPLSENRVYLSSHTYIVSENVHFSSMTPLILLMSAFLCKKSSFLSKIALLFKVWELCWRFFRSVFSFCKIKGNYWWQCKFYRPCVRNPASWLLQIGHKLEKWQWHHNFLTWRHRQFFWRCRVSLAKSSYWSKFYVNIILVLE